MVMKVWKGTKEKKVTREREARSRVYLEGKRRGKRTQVKLRIRRGKEIKSGRGMKGKREEKKNEGTKRK